MLIDDADNITFESPDERRSYRRYERLMGKAMKLAAISTDTAEFRQTVLEAENLYATFGSFD